MVVELSTRYASTDSVESRFPSLYVYQSEGCVNVVSAVVFEP